VRLVPEVIEIGEDITLRQPRINDLEIKTPLYSLLMPTRRGSTFEYPSAFLELQVRGKNNSVISEEMMRHLTLLRLYRPMSVSHTQIEVSNNGVMWFSAAMTLTPGSIEATPVRGTLTDEDGVKLPKFIEAVGPHLPRGPLAGEDDATDHVGNAMARYNDALLSHQPIEGRLASSIMALEALLLKNDEQDELIERLALRTAKILSFLGMRALEVYGILKRAYPVRSRYVHGGTLTSEERKQAQRLFTSVVEYVRICLVLFVLLRADQVEKDNYLSRITNALLDPNANDKLNRSLPKVWTASCSRNHETLPIGSVPHI